MIVFGLLVIKKMIEHATTKFIVTNKRIIFKQGWITSKTTEININQIESARIEQNIYQKMFDYGNLIIGGTGATLLKISNINNPKELRRAINI